jgi:hypothetical protein
LMSPAALRLPTFTQTWLSSSTFTLARSPFAMNGLSCH